MREKAVTKRRCLSVLAVVGCLICMTAILLINPGHTGSAEAEQFVLDGVLQEIYSVGDALSVPEGKFTLPGGDTATVKGVVVYPSGTAYARQDIVLTEAGQYTVRYTAEADGTIFRHESRFTACNPLYAFTGDSSSAEYGTSYYEKTGLKVSLAEGESLVFHTILDLNGASGSDTFLELFAAPADLSRVEHKKISITLTDVEDETNFVTLLNQGTLEEWAYTLVGANGQEMVGQESAGGKLHVGNQWGCATYYRYYGEYTQFKPADLGSRTLRFGFDAETNAFYVSGVMIADLDSPSFYKTLWHGFTSGRVKMTISCDEYYAEYANFVITSLSGVDLTQNAVKDTTPPVITIDTLGYSRAPDAVVGVPYPVFAASAQDDYSGHIAPEVSVYRLQDTNLSQIKVENGAFTPAVKGEYEIRYTATDYFGNRTTERIYVTATQGEIAKPQIYLENNGDVYGVVGAKMALSDYGVTGGSGLVDVCVQAISVDETIEVTDSYFIPMHAGSYSVVYRARDYLGQTAVAYYTVAVDMGYLPIFTQDARLPQYFISGGEYTLEEFYATDYAAGGAQVLADARMTDAAGTHEIAYGQTFSPVVDNHLDCVTITYRAGMAETEYRIPVVVVKDEQGQICMENYFIQEGVRLDPLSYGIRITADEQGGTWQFAKKQTAEDFSVQFAGVAASGQTHGGIRLTLQDSLDSDIRLELVVAQSGTQTLLTLGNVSSLSEFSWRNEGEVLTVALQEGILAVNDIKLVLSQDISGKAFTGFPSHYVYVSVAFIGAETGAQYVLNSINDQLLNNSGNDKLAPKVFLLDENCGGSFRIGEYATLPAAICGDVLSDRVSFTVSVTDPSYLPVTAEDGTVLDMADPSRPYTIRLDEYGTYLVRFYARDDSGNEIEYTVTINVIDYEKPDITFAKGYATEGSAGQEFQLAEVTVRDNMTAEEDLSVYYVVVSPSGKKEIVDYRGDGYGYTPEESGTYEIRCIAVDAAGNMQIAGYTVRIK